MTEDQLLNRYAMPLHERIRASNNARRLYRENPTFRLKAINRVRAKRGKPLLMELSQSKALRI